MMRIKKTYCAINDLDCPYYFKGECKIEDLNECDDIEIFWEENEREENEN